MIDLCRIDKGNLDAFSPILPKNIVDMISRDDATIALGAYDDERDNVVVGAIVGDLTEGGVVITYLYVVPGDRRQGIGSYLIDYVADRALACQLPGLRVEYPENEQSREFADFLDYMGFSREETETCSYDIKISDAKQVKLFADLSEKTLSTSVVSLEDTPRKLMNALAGELYEDGITVLYDLLHSEEINEQLSFVYLDGQEIRSVMICSDSDDGVNVEWVYSDPEYSTLLLPTMKMLAARLAERLSDDAVMHIIGMTGNAVGLLDGIFKEHVTSKERWVARDLVI